MVASSHFFVLIATLSLFLAFMAVMVSTIVVTACDHPGPSSGRRSLRQNEMIGKLIKQADYALLATVLYVLALGLYSLFVDDRIPMPGWLRIHDLGQLKELLAGVVVVAIAVIFLGWALTWDGKSDILALGVGSAAVIGGLALFLWQAARERQMESAERLEEATRAGRSAGRAPPRRRGSAATEVPSAPAVRATGPARREAPPGVRNRLEVLIFKDRSRAHQLALVAVDACSRHRGAARERRRRAETGSQTGGVRAHRTTIRRSVGGATGARRRAPRQGVALGHPHGGAGLAVLMTGVIASASPTSATCCTSASWPSPRGFLQITDILATFGAFMAVLIAIEIFVNIVSYLRDDVIHVRIVLATALMAIARKVIILDYSTTSSEYVYATAAVVAAMALAYWLVVRTPRADVPEPE